MSPYDSKGHGILEKSYEAPPQKNALPGTLQEEEYGVFIQGTTQIKCHHHLDSKNHACYKMLLSPTPKERGLPGTPKKKKKELGIYRRSNTR
jgi:hypothetical protein